MRRLFCSAGLVVALGFGVSAWADDKKDSDNKPKDYKKEFQDYTVVNNLRGKLVKVDKGQSLELEVAVNAKTNKKIDFPTLDNMEVLWVNPPVELDDKGKPKKVKPQDRKKPVTGPGGIKGYPADPSDLKNGQIIQVILMQKKAKPGSKDKADNKPSVGAVYIIAEPKS